jgi:hypothetical protein
MPRSRSIRNTGRQASSAAGGGEGSLRAHYLAADYLVLGGAPFTLKVDCASAPLQELQRRQGVDCSAFLTASNPGSLLRRDGENERAQRQLLSLLQQRGYAILPGRGVDPAGAWPPEESVLALGIRAEEARALARQFGQNALLVMAADAVPRLLWTGSADAAPG